MWFSVHLKFPTLMTLNSEIEWNMFFRFLHPNQFKLIHCHDRPEREGVRWLCNMYENLRLCSWPRARLASKLLESINCVTTRGTYDSVTTGGIIVNKQPENRINCPTHSHNCEKYCYIYRLINDICASFIKISDFSFSLNIYLFHIYATLYAYCTFAFTFTCTQKDWNRQYRETVTHRLWNKNKI